MTARALSFILFCHIQRLEDQPVDPDKKDSTKDHGYQFCERKRKPHCSQPETFCENKCRRDQDDQLSGG